MIRDQSHFVPLTHKLAAQMVRVRTRFHRHETTRYVCQKRQQLVPRKSFSADYYSVIDEQFPTTERWAYKLSL